MSLLDRMDRLIERVDMSTQAAQRKYEQTRRDLDAAKTAFERAEQQAAAAAALIAQRQSDAEARCRDIEKELADLNQEILRQEGRLP